MLDYKALFWDSVRSYFAPLVAVYRAIKREALRAERDHTRAA